MAQSIEPEPLSRKLAGGVIILAIVIGTALAVNGFDKHKGRLQIRDIEIENKDETVRQLDLKLNKTNQVITDQLESKESDQKRLEEAEKEKLRLEQELQKTKEQLQAKLDAKNNQSNTAYAGAEKPQPVGDKSTWMTQAGIPQSDWAYVDWMVQHESGWKHTADNPSSSAYGLCQALPGSKMATAGADWKTNPVTQLKWCHSYALSRYGTWAKAKAHWLAKVPIKGKSVGNWW